MKETKKLSPGNTSGDGAPKLSGFFKVIADETRIRILTVLLGGERCVSEICDKVGMSQSATSHQLAILKKADLVRVEKKGKNNVYSISDEHVRMIIDMALLHVSEKENENEKG